VLAIPFMLNSSRHGVTGLRGRALTWRALWLASSAGLFFALDLGFWNTSLLYTSAANSTLLGNTSTLWVSLGAVWIFHESLKRRFWLGMLLALAGAVIIVGRDVVEHPNLGWGDLLAVGSSLFYAGYLLGTQRARQYWATLPFMWVSSVAATLALLSFILFMGLPLGGFTLDTWLALLALGLISHVLGWLSINYALGHLPAPITAVSLLSQPVITAIIAVPLLGEHLSIYQIGGGLLVLVGIYVVNRH
jgi:drug/metabolite transporter (DMT)-like permease